MPMQLYEESDRVPSPMPATSNPYSMPSQTDDAILAPIQQITQFISKIGQVVLRARVGPRYDRASAAGHLEQQRRMELKLAAAAMRRPQCRLVHAPGTAEEAMSPVDCVDVGALVERTDFWQTSMPVNVDIYLGECKTLLERWVVSYEQSEKVRAGRSSPTMRKADVTELILMVQSLYSYVRLMPLHTILSEGKIDRSEIRYCISTADGYPLSPVSDEEQSSPIEQELAAAGVGGRKRRDYFDNARNSFPENVAFDLGAKLKVYKFRSASTGTSGKLHLSVVYDSSVAGIIGFGGIKGHSPVKSPTKGLGGEGNQFSSRPSPQCTGKPPRPASAPAGQRRRSSLGSPFPSPTLQKRVIGLAHWKLSSAERPRPPTGLGIQTRHGPLLFSGLELDVPSLNAHRDEDNYISSADAQNAATPVEAVLREPFSDTTMVSAERTLGILPQRTRKPNLRLSIPDPKTFVPDNQSHAGTASNTTKLRSINIPLSAMHSRQASFSTHTPHATPAELYGSLVGSYEESILSGRMSTLPSKPIRFLAEIGVVGFGKCGSRGLRCPPHVCIGFDAFFYEVGEEEVLTPYVGCIDIAEAKQKKDGMELHVDEDGYHLGSNEGKREYSKGYRIPPKGQLQILIKNPARTAIKLFLIPYDFCDMPTNSKTFLRQKSYAVPKEADSAVSHSDSHNHPHRPHLRYAIHIPVLRTEKGRLYVGPTLRVVFSHRALDGDEKVLVISENLGLGDGKYMKGAGDYEGIIGTNYSTGGLDVSEKRTVREEAPALQEKVWSSGFR